MKTKMKLLFVIGMLLLSVDLFAAGVSITKPTDNQTLYITSGTTRSVELKWGYTIDPGTSVWSFSTNTSGSWSSYELVTSKTINNVQAGSYTWKVRMQTYKDGSYSYYDDEVSFTVSLASYTIIAQNNFGGGQIKVGVNSSVITKSSPYTFSANTSDVVYLEAVDNQSSGGYTRIWNNGDAPLNESDWSKKEVGYNFGYFDDTKATDFVVNSTDDGATYQANLRKVCNITFTNNFNGTSETETITVNGSTVPAPTSNYPVVEQNTITATAGGFEIDDVHYVFSNWDNNVADSFKTKTFTESSHFNHVANFIGTPQCDHLHLSFNSYNPRVQQYITLDWDELASPGITKYYVWRKVQGSAAVNIATVYRGTTTYVDYDYYLAASGTNINLSYGIQAYFEPDNTVSNIWFSSVNGESAQASKIAQSDSTSNESPKVEKFALNLNYPNPFNPTTQISYQLPENSFVNLIVYNALGQEVARLVNQRQSSGKYSVQFNAANLPSGVYIYKLQTGEFSNVKKMLLTK